MFGLATMVPNRMRVVDAASPVSQGYVACQARSRYRCHDRWSYTHTWS